MTLVFGASCRECGSSNEDCYTLHWVSGGQRHCCDPCTDAHLDWWGTPHVASAAGVPDGEPPGLP